MSDDKVLTLPNRRRRACPTCGKPSVDSFRPFCSSRCRDVDLGRWLGGVYAVPAVEADAEDLDGESGDA